MAISYVTGLCYTMSNGIKICRDQEVSHSESIYSNLFDPNTSPFMAYYSDKTTKNDYDLNPDVVSFVAYDYNDNVLESAKGTIQSLDNFINTNNIQYVKYYIPYDSTTYTYKNAYTNVPYYSIDDVKNNLKLSYITFVEFNNKFPSHQCVFNFEKNHK